MPCLDETALAELVEGTVPEHTRATLERHIDACRECYELVTCYAQAYLSHGTGEPDDGASLPLLRGDSVGRYVVLDCVGMGSMGTVYSAFDPELDRRVALKLLRARHGGGRDAQRQLLGEARALAQLSHPNVVAIYDVGTLTDRVFIATELVDGCTLTQWLGRGAHAWRPIVDVFLAAGEGLAAAHAAGIVHRDFKPDNVLVGADGRVRVADFGMARSFADEVGSEAPGPDDPRALIGTPIYMAPEQLEGRPADARSDQFSFCVALFEAVCGQRPFAGRNLAELGEQVRRGEPRPPPPERRVPAWLLAIVTRGLAAAPTARHADMRALLGLLRQTPRRRTRRRWIAAAALVLTASSAGAYALAQRNTPDPASPLCSGAQAKLDGVWDEHTRDAARAAFVATRLPYAADAWQSVRRTLDARAETWAAAYTENCLATRARGEQSEAAMDLRVACLDRHREELRALSELLVAADDDVVLAAADLGHALADPAACNDLEALQARARPDLAHPEAATLHAAVARARTHRRAGKLAQARSLAAAAHARASELNLGWLVAEAGFELGRAEGDLAEDLAAAEQTLADAVWSAEAHGNVEAAADGWMELVRVRKARADYAGAEEAGRRADAAIFRLADRERAAQLAVHRGELHSARAQYDQALASYREALAAFTALGPTHATDLARTQSNIGAALGHQGHHEQALVALYAAAEALERELGGDHPDLATIRNNIAATLSRLGRRSEAVALLRQVLAARERVFGHNHPRSLPTLQNIASIQIERGQPGEAQELLRRALAIQEQTLGPEHPNLGTTLGNLALALRPLGARDEARALLERALQIQEQALGPDHPNLGVTLMSLGGEQMHAGDLEAALASFERGLAIRRKQYGPEHELVGRALKRVGDCQRKMGDIPAAIATLEHAVRLLDRGADPLGPLDARVSLAGALWLRPHERTRSAQMMLANRDKLQTMTDVPREMQGVIDRWFAAHPEALALAEPR